MQKSKAALQHSVILMILGEHAKKGKPKKKPEDEPEDDDDNPAEEANEKKKGAKARKVVR